MTTCRARARRRKRERVASVALCRASSSSVDPPAFRVRTSPAAVAVPLRRHPRAFQRGVRLYLTVPPRLRCLLLRRLQRAVLIRDVRADEDANDLPRAERRRVPDGIGARHRARVVELAPFALGREVIPRVPRVRV
eukprot:31365-Pelagococcus_subviridis.AAC.14